MHKSNTLKVSWCLFVILLSSPSLPPSHFQATSNLPAITVQSLLFLKLYINGIIQYVLFVIWLHSNRMIILKFTHIVAWVNNSFFLTSSTTVCLYLAQVEWHLSCSQALLLADKVAKNILVQVSIWIYTSISPV